MFIEETLISKIKLNWITEKEITKLSGPSAAEFVMTKILT